MRFWDSSAILPLLVPAPESGQLAALMRDDPSAAVWWGTPVECASALARLEREGRLGAADWDVATSRLHAAARGWTEVPPIGRVRDQATRLLRLHPLRAADALQLAAAVVLADFEPGTLPFVTLDEQLRAAARREGFRVFGAQS
ncbi:MAG TPA: type II toxin-antitoxin system VapC family toxin [Gemmatimonadales bacterium]